MLGTNKVICISGKNQCAIDALNFVIKKYNNYKIYSLPNKSDNGKNNWQNSFKEHSIKNKIEVTDIKKLHKIEKLYFFSLEYESIIDVSKFKSKKLFNFHFSLLPKYRGCHTNFYQIYNGEKQSGVTLHKIEKGIDTGKIIDLKKFNIPINATAYSNYIKLMKCAFLLFRKNFDSLLNDRYKLKKQFIRKGSYFNRNSVNYSKLVNIDNFDNNLKTHNKIRSLIFPPFQLPIYKGKKIIKSKFINKKIKLYYL
tara:strand:+ start:87 stop:845 length:759 start_codon:yes stop_codon:yes gene_type:complete